MKEARRGSRTIVVQDREYSWFRGKSSTEIRNLETNKAVVVANGDLEEVLEDSPDAFCAVIKPSHVRDYILRSQL